MNRIWLVVCFYNIIKDTSGIKSWPQGVGSTLFNFTPGLCCSKLCGLCVCLSVSSLLSQLFSSLLLSSNVLFAPWLIADSQHNCTLLYIQQHDKYTHLGTGYELLFSSPGRIDSVEIIAAFQQLCVVIMKQFEMQQWGLHERIQDNICFSINPRLNVVDNKVWLCPVCPLVEFIKEK